MAVPAVSLSLAAAPATVTGSPRVFPQPHAAGETCALAPHITVLAGRGSSRHFHMWFVTITWSQDSALGRTQGLCTPQEVALAGARLGQAQGCSGACWLRMR